MRILQVVPYFPPAYAFGGPAQAVYQISRALQKRGHEVVVYTTDAKDFASRLNSITINMHDGIVINRFRNFSMSSVRRFKLFITPSLIPKVKNDIRSFDIVHLHEYRTLQNVVVHRYARRAGVPYIMQAHGSISRVGSWKRLKLVFDSLFGFRILTDSSSLIALSQVEAEQYMGMGVPKEKIAIIPNGIDLSEYASLPPKGRFKKKFSIPEDKKIVLYLGRIHRIKGIDFMVKAYAYLTKKMNFKDTVLVMAGPDDGYLSEVKRLVSSLNLANKIVFTGKLSEEEKISAYVDSNVVVNVEPRNVFGLVPLEAAACLKPVIVSRDNAISEIIHEGNFGFSVNYGDITALAKITETILRDDDLANEMGRRGREYVFANFDWSKIVTKLEKVYENSCI